MRTLVPCFSGGGSGAEMGEEIGHLKRATNGLRTLADPRLGLFDAVER